MTQFLQQFAKFLVCTTALWILTAQVASADCYQKLTENFSADATHFELPETAVDLSIQRETVLFAKHAVVELLDRLQCYGGRNVQDYSIKKLKNVSCREVAPGARFSRTCYAESEFGYFLVKVDAMEQIHLQFFRWD
mgnify:CR=1 FL=1